MSKYLYFIASSTPTSAEAVKISRLQSLLRPGDTFFVRNSSEKTGYGDNREACDYILGIVPDLYKVLYARAGGAKNQLTEHYDGALIATTAGAAGNAITVKFLGDRGAGLGVSIVRNGTDFVIHYESGVSTVGNVNTAITALAGGDDLFGVETAGTTANVLTASDNAGPMTFAGGAAAVSIGNQAVTDAAEAFKVFPTTISISAATSEAPVYAISADLNETTGAVTMTDLSKNAKVNWTSADEAKCTVDTDGVVTRIGNGGPTNVTATYTAVVAAKASLNCSLIPRSKLDTVIAASTAGTAGNDISVEMVGDAGAKAGSIERTEKAFTIHYKPGVSTVGDVETLITNLANDDDLIGVETGGTGATILSTIDVKDVSGNTLESYNPDFPAQFLTGGLAAVTSTASVAVTTTA